jgi:hypothetical protein
MASSTATYVVSANPNPQGKIPSILNIYTIQNGQDQQVINFNASQNLYQTTFTNLSSGNEFYLAAVEIGAQPPQVVTVSVYENGTLLSTGSNATNPRLLAGVSGSFT